jgi:hypothetical protein
VEIGHLLTTDSQDWILICLGLGEGRIIKDKSPDSSVDQSGRTRRGMEVHMLLLLQSVKVS